MNTFKKKIHKFVTSLINYYKRFQVPHEKVEIDENNTASYILSRKQ